MAENLPSLNLEDNQDSLFLLARDKVRDFLQQDRTSASPALVTTMLLDLAQMVSDRIESEIPSGKKACEKGCSYCCHYEVILSPPEIFLVGGHVDACFSGKEKGALTGRLDQYLADTEGRSPEQRALTLRDTPCPFLENGSCQIYAVRPFICRAWNGLNRQQCKSAYEEGKPWEEANSQSRPYYIFGTLKKALQGGCALMGYQSEDLPMVSAMKRRFGHRNHTEKWLQGDKVFSPLRDGT